MMTPIMKSKFIERIESMNFFKFLFIFGVIPACLYFPIHYYVLVPAIQETFNSAGMIIFGIIAFVAMFLILTAGVLMGINSWFWLYSKARIKLDKQTTQYVAHILATDKKIREEVVSGIVEGINAEIMKNSPVIIDIQKKMEKIERLLGEEADIKNNKKNIKPINKFNKFEPIDDEK